MQPDNKKRKDKDILAYVRELERLHAVTRNAPVVPLAQPYQNGWTKYFTLRDDYTRRDDAYIHNAIIEKIGRSAFCRKTDFKDRKGREFGPWLGIIPKGQWDFPESYKKYFSYGLHFEYYPYAAECGYFSRQPILGYKFLRPYCFVEAVKPHFITHTRLIFPDIESRVAYINNVFERNRHWDRYGKIKGHSKRDDRERLTYKGYLESFGTKEIENYDLYTEDAY